ncbi:MAG: hypothetical protein ACR2QL_02980 [Woeseiaceae bacterium]
MIRPYPHSLVMLSFIMVASGALADDQAAIEPMSDVDTHDVPVHNALETKYWLSAVDLFATRAFNVTADGSVTPQIPRQYVDFESDLDVDDSPELYIVEFRWRFAARWNLGLQYFQSTRSGRRTLERTIEWNDTIFDIGADVRAKTEIDITRIVLSYHFIRKKGHDFRLTGGVHWLDIAGRISGEATLGDGSTEFAASTASASLPIPNVGGVYMYSPSSKWLLGLRADWFSASVGDYSGGIWNVMANVNYQVGENVGLGFGYQFFQLHGEVTDDGWRGDLRVRFDGPFLQLSGFW